MVATATTAPFAATWANAPAGTYSLTAPAANATYTLTATVTLSANASGVEVNTPIS